MSLAEGVKDDVSLARLAKDQTWVLCHSSTYPPSRAWALHGARVRKGDGVSSFLERETEVPK